MLVPLPSSDPGLLAFGRRLKAAREARGVTHGWLAEHAGVSKLTLGLVEQGRLRLSSSDLHRVTNALRLPLAFLMTDRSDVKALKPLE